MQSVQEKIVYRVNIMTKSSEKNTIADTRCIRLEGHRLNVNGQVVTDKDAVLTEWAHHFKDLSSSRASESDSRISTYRCASFEKDA